MAGRILTRLLLVAGVALYWIGAAGLIRWIGRNSPKVLLYHDVAEAENDYTAGLNCTTPPALFAAHLDYLRRHYAVVSIDELVAGRAPVLAAAITFDDGYRSVFTGAFPHLSARALPATIYLIADVVDNAVLVWVNELNHALRTGGEAARAAATAMLDLPADSAVEAIVDHVRVAYDAATVQALLARLREDGGESPADHARRAALYVSTAEIGEMTAGGISFGNHTRTHPNLARLSDAAQAREIGEAQATLAARFAMIPSLAYPFGHHNASSEAIARAAGLTSVAEVGGFNRRANPGRIARVHLSDETIPQLFARMEVVEPVKGLLRDLAGRGRSLTPA